MEKYSKISLNLFNILLSLALLFLAFQAGRSLVAYGRLTVDAIGFPYVLDYGEGPLLDQTLRLASGEAIYRNNFAAPPYTISNYPPVYLLIQAPFSMLFGPAFWYGRLISLISALLAALFIGLTLYTLTRNRLASLIGGLLLLIFPYSQYWSLLDRIDFLALALSWAAIFVTIRFWDRRWGIPLAAGLFIASIYTRQTYALAGPFAVFVWLLVNRQGRKALTLALLTGGTTIALFLLINLLTAGGFYLNIIAANVNPFYWNIVQRNFKEFWDNTYFLVVIAGLFLLAERFFRHTRTWPLVLPYAIAATATAITIGKDGSNVNYLLELAAATSLAAGASLAWFVARSRWLAPAIILALAVQTGQMVGWMHGDYENRIMEKVNQRVQLLQLYQIVRQTDGIVLADEYMGLVPLAGKRLYYQPFEFKMLAEGGLWDEKPFLDAIQQNQFALILMYQPGTWPAIESRWTPAMRSAIPVIYRLDKFVAYDKVYRPRK